MEILTKWGTCFGDVSIFYIGTDKNLKMLLEWKFKICVTEYYLLDTKSSVKFVQPSEASKMCNDKTSTFSEIFHHVHPNLLKGIRVGIYLVIKIKSYKNYGRNNILIILIYWIFAKGKFLLLVKGLKFLGKITIFH